MGCARAAFLAACVLVLNLPLGRAFEDTLAPADAQQTQVVRDVRFGLNQAWEAADAADMAGAGWSRLTFWWSAFQPRSPNDWNLFATDHDSYIDDELARGRELAGVVLNVPPWASSNGSPNGVPKNLHLRWDHPENYWGRFARRLAAHYRGRVNTWIIWNEVDIPAGQWQTWDGSIEDYAQLLRVSYAAIKAGNPDARVALYGSPWWYDRGDYLMRLLNVLAADPEAARSNHFFDIANLHMYSRANDIPHVIPWYREQLALRGIGEKPVWIGETNAIPYDDPLWPAGKGGFRASMDEQASYLVAAFATYLALGVERIGVNRVRDGADFDAGGEPFGLIRNDGSRRPVYAAFQVISRYFAGARTATLYPTDVSGLTRVILETDGGRVNVVWTMRPQPISVDIEAAAPAALRVGKYGEAETVLADGGVYRLDLPPATANSNDADPEDYVVGGSPIILVERYDGDVAAAYRPLDVPPVALGARPPPAPAAAGGGATPRPTPRPTPTPTQRR